MSTHHSWHGHHNHRHDSDHDREGHDHDGHSHSGLRGALTSVLRPHSHDAADSVDRALENSREGIRAVKISLVALAVTAGAQLLVFAASGSVALFADTVHNASDALTALPLWLAFTLAQRPPSRRYTYGYGRVEDLAGLFIVMMIALSTLIAGWESIQRLLHPAPVAHLGWVAVAGLVGFAGNEAVAVFRIRVGRRIHSAALVADGHHARVDGFTSLAVVIGAGGVALGWPLADPIIGLLITVAIAMVLVSAARDVFRRLLDGVDPDLVDKADEVLAAQPGVIAVRRVRLRWIGHQLHADADLDIAGSTSTSAAHALAHESEARLMHALPNLAGAVVHAYPDTHTPTAAEPSRTRSST